MTLRFRSLALGLIIGLVGAFASVLEPVFELERSIGLRALFSARGPRPPPKDVVVIAIDRQSAQALGLSSKPSQWPRRMHAELIERLAEAGAKMIAFDLLFEAQSLDERGDELLAAAMRKAGNVVLVAALQSNDASPPNSRSRDSGPIMLETLIPPLPTFVDAAIVYAPFPLPKGERVDAYWTFKPGAGEFPTVPAVALQVFAIDCFPHLLESWRGADASLVTRSSFDAGTATSRSALLELMQAQRSALSGDRVGAGRRLPVHMKASSDPSEGAPCDAHLALTDLYSGDGARFFNFYGPARTIETISYSDALEGLRTAHAAKGAGSAFSGKAVFVGFSPALASEEDRIRDDYRTVYSASDGLDLSGVEIIATAFANLLHQRSLRPLDGFGNMLLVFSWGVAIGALARDVRISFSVLFVGVAGGFYLAVARYAFGEAALWLPLIIPLGLQPPLALFAGALLRHREAQWERERIKRIFGHYLPATVVEQLTSNVGPPTSINRVVFGVCLATDAQQYTSLAETMEPARLAQILNAYYRRLFEAVQHNGGRVADVVGDAMLAIWAGSGPEDSMRSSACQAALDIAASAGGDDSEGEGGAIPTRVGIHCGEILLGNFGAGERFEFRAVGDVVNTASRIEGLGKHLGARLLVSEDVIASADRYLSRPLGAFLLVGKHNPVRVAELCELRAEASEQESWRCLRFAAALSQYESGHWAESATTLAEVLAAFPSDGPALFYRERCAQLVLQPPAGPWDPVIRMELK